MTILRRALVAFALVLSTSVPQSGVGPPVVAETPDHAPFYVTDVEARYLESFPVQVQLVVSGSVPSPCHVPAWTVSDDGAFVVVELWSEADPEALCATVLQEVEVVIPLGEYERAERAVLVNDRLAERVSVGPSEEAETRLFAAGWSFGMCLSYCRADLVAVGDRLRLQVGDNPTDTPVLLNHGTLTAEGSTQLAAVLEAIEPAALEETYGCPDCADGGAAYVALIADGEGSRHDMPFGEPPAELAPLYALTQALIGSLETCTSGELVVVDDDCEPHQDEA